MKIVKVIGLVCMFAFAGVFIWGMIDLAAQRNKEMRGEVPLPVNINIAYKQEERATTAPYVRYAVYDTRGYQYYASKSEFDSLNAPQKIGEGLYRLPDGSYIGQVVK